MMGVLATCLIMAAQTYAVPPSVLFGIYHTEGGRTGQIVGPNENGSYDIGPMQINSIWVPKLAKIWNVSDKTAFKWLRDDTCTNAGVSAWILRNHLEETGDLAKAIAYYHSRTPRFGSVYRNKVITSIINNGYMQVDDAVAPVATYSYGAPAKRHKTGM